MCKCRMCFAVKETPTVALSAEVRMSASGGNEERGVFATGIVVDEVIGEDEYWCILRNLGTEVVNKLYICQFYGVNRMGDLQKESVTN